MFSQDTNNITKLHYRLVWLEVTDEMMIHLNEDDEGKAVLTNNGKEIGHIERFEEGTAYVEPKELVPSTTKRKLNWRDKEDNQYVLQNTMVHSITEDAVRIRR